MKWNSLSISAICIVIGIGGFMLGKLTSKSAELSEQDRLLQSSERLIQQRSTSGGMYSRSREKSTRLNRPSKQRGDTSFDQKLVNMEEIVRGENALHRGRAMLKWIDSLAPEEFEATLARFRSLGLTGARMGEYTMLLSAWAEVDPVSALAYTIENTNRRISTGTVLTAWATRDPEAAIAWAKANQIGNEANPYMIGVIRGLVASDPARATALLQEMPFSRERASALDAIMPHISKMGAEAVKKWIADLTDERLREYAVPQFATTLAKQDPAGTASWLLDNINNKSVRSVEGVFDEWAKVDPEAAIANFESLPQGEARSHALRGIIMQGAYNNPQSTAELMNRFPEDINDLTTQRFVYGSMDKAPNVAASQIGLIKNEHHRNFLYENTLDNWLKRDQAAAQTWINSANLPASVINALGQR